MIPHMRWGTCSGDDNECGGNIISERRDVDFGPVVVKNMPVGVCEVCGEEYHNLFFGAEIEWQTITAIWRILDWKHLRKK
jgi:YgiT-type zinc finger domain-containing protein